MVRTLSVAALAAVLGMCSPQTGEAGEAGPPTPEGKVPVADGAATRKAHRIYRRGLKYFEEFRYERALKFFEAAVEAEPKHVKAKEYLKKTRVVLGMEAAPGPARAGAQAEEGAAKGSAAKKGDDPEELLAVIDKAVKEAEGHAKAAETRDAVADAGLKPEELVVRSIDNYERCIKQCDRVLTILSWMPVKVDASKQRRQVRALRGSAGKALQEKVKVLRLLRRVEAMGDRGKSIGVIERNR